MAIRVGINGFGRIGRLVFRAICEQGLLGKEIEVVAVNDIVPADNLAYLVKYDSTQGKFPGTVTSKKSKPDAAEDDVLVVNGQKSSASPSRKAPRRCRGKQLGVDIVIESTGLFTEAEKAKGHLDGRREESHHLAPRPRTKTSPSSWASTTRNTTRPSTTSFPTRAARRTAWRRSSTCC